jgi:hypothetical protein
MYSLYSCGGEWGHAKAFAAKTDSRNGRLVGPVVAGRPRFLSDNMIAHTKVTNK